MRGNIERMIKFLTVKPKIIFLIDGLGASSTAILLITVLQTYNEYFGMPQKILIMLSIIAAVLAIYSIFCFAFLARQNIQKFLKPIIISNLIYCFLTVGLVLYYYNELTILGITYFSAEILIISGLVYIELKTLKTLSQNSSK